MYNTMQQVAYAVTYTAAPVDVGYQDSRYLSPLFQRPVMAEHGPVNLLLHDLQLQYP